MLHEISAEAGLIHPANSTVLTIPSKRRSKYFMGVLWLAYTQIGRRHESKLRKIRVKYQGQHGCLLAIRKARIISARFHISYHTTLALA